MHRFFISPDLLKQEEILFPQETAYQICRVLRLEPGKKVQVLDGSGWEFTVELTDVQMHNVKGKILAKALSPGEPVTNVNMYLALTQRERFEWMLQKCTEIGVTAFTPLITSRSLIQRLSEVEGKVPRWCKIIQEAAEQSHRGIIPQINPTVTYSQSMRNALEPHVTGLFFWEEESKTRLKDAIKSLKTRQINLVIGPEGGFTSDEADLAMKAGYISVSLGTRILRVETAAIIAAGLVLYELG